VFKNATCSLFSEIWSAHKHAWLICAVVNQRWYCIYTLMWNLSSHGGDYEQHCILGCDALQHAVSILTFGGTYCCQLQVKVLLFYMGDSMSLRNVGKPLPDYMVSDSSLVMTRSTFLNTWKKKWYASHGSQSLGYEQNKIQQIQLSVALKKQNLRMH
jgi:hypothetical protein